MCNENTFHKAAKHITLFRAWPLIAGAGAECGVLNKAANSNNRKHTASMKTENIYVYVCAY
jgi:hypothetical protein